MSTERDPLDERLFVVDDETWSAFSERLERPAEKKPRLADLLREPQEDDD